MIEPTPKVNHSCFELFILPSPLTTLITSGFPSIVQFIKRFAQLFKREGRRKTKEEEKVAVDAKTVPAALTLLISGENSQG